MYNLVSIKINNFLSIENVDFNFNNKEPFILVGKNLDDSGQPKNGAGKSSLIEAISFAITGLTLRDVPVKKLIRRGQLRATVILELQSHQNRLIIQRIIDNKSAKSTKILLNNVEVELSDENEKNQYILNEIGISKDDFFQFFMVTRDRYHPFYLSSDTEKKAIINRFSGADVIDQVYPYIKVEVDKNQAEINQQKIFINRLNFEIEYLKQEIIKLTNQSQDNFKDEILKLEEKIVLKLENIKTIKISTEQYIQEIDKLKSELDALKVHNFSELILLSTEEKKSLRNDQDIVREQIKVVNDKYNVLILEVQKNKRELEQKIKELEASKNETINILAETKNKLYEAIECPKCHHEFIVDDDFNLEEGKEFLVECEQILIEIKENIKAHTNLKNELIEKISTYNLEYEQELSNLKDNINIILNNIEIKEREILTLNDKKNKIKIEINNKETKISTNLDTIKYNETKVSSAQKEIEDLKIKIKQLKDFKIDQAKIDELNELIEAKIKLCEEHNVKLSEHEDENNSISQWELNFKNFKSYLANQSIENIENYNNLYLKSLGSDLSIKLDGYKEVGKKLKEQIDITVLRNGFEIGSYGEFSQGERCRIDFANIIAIQTLINLNSHNGLNFIVVDDVLDVLDVVGIELIINSLKQIEKPMLVVSQQEINSLPNNTITMIKENEVSTLYIN